MRHSPNQTDARRNVRRSTIEEEARDSPETRRQIRDSLSTLDIPGTPSVRVAKGARAMGLPMWCGTRHVQSISVTRGDPQHGAMRSDDHIGHFEIEIPFEEINWDDVDGKNDELFGDRSWVDVCRECGCQRALYRYQATHFIAGSQSIFCPDCEAQYASEDWG